jgi:hypothetical protein
MQVNLHASLFGISDATALLDRESSSFNQHSLIPVKVLQLFPWLVLYYFILVRCIQLRIYYEGPISVYEIASHERHLP